MQRSALCRSRRELSNEYLLAKVGFDTAENEPCKVCPLSAYRSPRFKHYDRTESADGRLTGFVSEDTFIAGIGEHGLTDEEFFIFLTPFKRNDDKVEYARLIEHLFPQDAPLPK